MGPSAADPTANTNHHPSDATRALRVAIDATPLMNRRTGVGAVTASIFDQLGRSDEVEVTGYVVSWRARSRYGELMPDRAKALRLRWPARMTHQLWQRADWPRLPGRHDVVHGINYVVPPTRAGARLVTVHDLTAWRFPDLVDHHSLANPNLLDRAVATGSHVHCVSAAVGREVVEDLGIPDDVVHVIPNGFDPVGPGDGQRARTKMGGRYVLAIGTIEPRKDYVGLVAAMAGVWSRHPSIKLVIVGGDGWGVDRFHEAVRSSGAEDRIVRTGYVSSADKADLIAGAELLVYPSIYEGFGLPVLEAMDAGLPVVASAVDAVVEVAGDGALLVPPRDHDGLAAAVNLVIDDEATRSRLITAGKVRSQAFSWETTASALVDLYRRLAELR